ncbi:hypothetical protein COLO4_14908 [Corchorus olitorius]|uniref:Uncharacterized protein n=1 Tax=Corchorus olitorius TaxID=93759 RepID=A0A1R3JQ61_9ROSI|nr:hypothetical protein COLO4_14908 [Corchorus olitorius]
MGETIPIFLAIVSDNTTQAKSIKVTGYLIARRLTSFAIRCKVLAVIVKKVVFSEGVFLEKSKCCLNNFIRWLGIKDGQCKFHSA